MNSSRFSGDGNLGNRGRVRARYDDENALLDDLHCDLAAAVDDKKKVVFAFEVEDERKEVVLVLELRASKGSVSFRKDSLEVVPLQ